MKPLAANRTSSPSIGIPGVGAGAALQQRHDLGRGARRQRARPGRCRLNQGGRLKTWTRPCNRKHNFITGSTTNWKDGGKKGRGLPRKDCPWSVIIDGLDGRSRIITREHGCLFRVHHHRWSQPVFDVSSRWVRLFVAVRLTRRVRAAARVANARAPFVRAVRGPDQPHLPLRRESHLRDVRLDRVRKPWRREGSHKSGLGNKQVDLFPTKWSLFVGLCSFEYEVFGEMLVPVSHGTEKV